MDLFQPLGLSVSLVSPISNDQVSALITGSVGSDAGFVVGNADEVSVFACNS